MLDLLLLVQQRVRVETDCGGILCQGKDSGQKIRGCFIKSAERLCNLNFPAEVLSLIERRTHKHPVNSRKKELQAREHFLSTT